MHLWNEGTNPRVRNPPVSAQLVRGARARRRILRAYREPVRTHDHRLGPALAYRGLMHPNRRSRTDRQDLARWEEDGGTPVRFSADPKVTDGRTARRFFVLLLAATTLALALVVRPLAGALFMAAVLAGMIAPLQARLAAGLRGRPRLAAGIVVLAVFVVLVGPLVAFAAFLLKEGNEALKFVAGAVRSESVSHLVGKLPDSLEKIVGEALARLLDVDRMVEGQLTAQGGKAAAAVWGALSATGSVIFAAAMMLIALFFFLVQGGELVSWLDETLPLRPGQTRELLGEFKKVSFSVIASSIITSGVQAVAALAGFFISRVPHRSSSRPSPSSLRSSPPSAPPASACSQRGSSTSPGTPPGACSWRCGASSSSASWTTSSSRFSSRRAWRCEARWSSSR